MSHRSMELSITLDDPDVLSWIEEFPEKDRSARATTAIRVGVLALRQAAGFVDRQALHDEGARMANLAEKQVIEAMTDMVGPESQLMKTLDPHHADGLVAQLKKVLENELDEHGEQLLGAFDLNKPDSPLSRLIKYIHESQDTIRKDFSLDEPTSALSRLMNTLKTTLAEQEKHNREFRENVKTALAEMSVRKQADARGTVHGLDFEDALVSLISDRAAEANDIASATGATTGIVKACKVGDCVLTLGADNVHAGEKIVFEAKQAANYDLAKALNEIDLARRNREAQVGVFVFSASYAPKGLPPVSRHGRDVVAIWDSEDPTTDIWLNAALIIAKALVFESASGDLHEHDVDFRAITVAIEAIAKRAEKTDQVRTWGQTVESTAKKIIKEMETAREDFDKQLESLRNHIANAEKALQVTGSK